MNIKVGLCAIAACLGPITPALGANYTAVCENITGVRVDDIGSKVEYDGDQVRGGTWTFRWSDENQEVHMIMQNSRSAGGAQFTQPGYRITKGGNEVTFISPLSEAVWVYTIYGNGGNRLLVTQHTTTATGDRLSGKMMTGVCRAAW